MPASPNNLSPAMRALYRDCQRWGEIGPDAEDVAGCHGAAFQRVVSGLIARGLHDLIHHPSTAKELRP